MRRVKQLQPSLPPGACPYHNQLHCFVSGGWGLDVRAPSYVEHSFSLSLWGLASTALSLSFSVKVGGTLASILAGSIIISKLSKI